MLHEWMLRLVFRLTSTARCFDRYAAFQVLQCVPDALLAFGTIDVVLARRQPVSHAHLALGAARTRDGKGNCTQLGIYFVNLLKLKEFTDLCFKLHSFKQILNVYLFFFVGKEGALSQNACMACPAGRFSNRTGLSSLVQCDSCPGGTWSDVAGSTKNVCVKCQAGKWSPQIAAISEAVTKMLQQN